MSNQIVLKLAPGPGNARNSEAAMVTLRDGTVVIAWSKFTTEDGSDFGAGIIAARKSEDGGKTWSDELSPLISQEGAVNVMSPSLLRLHDGRIALLYLRKDRGDHCMPYIRFSSDELQSFTEPVQIIPVDGYHVVNNDRLIQLSSGRIVAPVAHGRMRGPRFVPVETNLEGDGTVFGDARSEPQLACAWLIVHYFSDDGGQTWYESLGSYYRCDEFGWGLDEPCAIELRDGRLWSWMRSGRIGLPGVGGRQWEAFSKDGGDTWSEPVPSQFVSPCSPMQVKRIPSTGDLLAVWNDQSGRFKLPPPLPVSWGRTPLACAISRDEGITWEGHKLLEDAPDQGFCYPAIHFVEDNVLIAYDAGGSQSKNPLDTQWVRLISLDEFYR